ncbi:MAG: Fic/DOC family N-terminal domain-containing protein [Agriterribacter sp.]
MPIGTYIQQPQGYKAFVPNTFPPNEFLAFPPEIVAKAALAERLLGKLDGITHVLPDVDFFLNMFRIKDATSSAQIEGTRATMMDALEMNAGLNVKDTDADDILFYINTLKYGTERLERVSVFVAVYKGTSQQIDDRGKK